MARVRIVRFLVRRRVVESNHDVTPNPQTTPASGPSVPVVDTDRKPTTRRCRYRPWHGLLRRAFEIDVLWCAACGGRMKLVALVKDAQEIERYLRHLGEPTGPPPLAPARAPPYWEVIRRRREGHRGDVADHHASA